MKLFRGVLIFVFLLVYLYVLRSAAAEKSWFEIRSAHLSLVTDAGEKRGIEIVRGCERMRAVFARLMDRASTHDPAPLLIFALHNENELDGLGDVLASRSRHSGLFLPGVDQAFILIDASGDPWHAAFHEYAHELLNANTSSRVQTWFDEGFAEYFSTFESNTQRVELGRVPVAQLQFLRANGKLMRLADLMRVNLNSQTYTQNGPRQELFYAESWLLVHYLFDHQLIGRAEPFFSLMASATTLDAAIQKSFGMSTQKLEDELLAYAKGEKFRYFSLLFNRDDVDMHADAQPISQVTVAALKLDLRWHSKPDHSKSDAQAYAAEYQSLLGREPQNVIALRGAGLAQLAMSNLESSFHYLRRALELKPGDPSSHYSLSLLLAAAEAAGVSEPDFATLEGEAEACIHLDPSFADAYRIAAFRWLRQGAFDRAEDAMRLAVALSPRTDTYKLQLADLELKKREYAPALALLQELRNSHNPEIASQAEYFLSSDTAAKQ
jgi:tetratricopeptide (TPR) repeat protein